MFRAAHQVKRRVLGGSPLRCFMHIHCGVIKACQQPELHRHAAVSASFGPLTEFSGDCWAAADGAGNSDVLLTDAAGQLCSVSGALRLHNAAQHHVLC